MGGTAASPATGAITCERKQRMTSDLDVVGQLKVRPIWNTTSSTEALTINATNTQSGAGTSLIKAQVGGTDKFVVDKDGNITAAGNLTVAGSTTTINSTNLSVSDTEIVIANGATTTSQANGAGLQLGSTNVSFKYESAGDRFNLTNAGLNIGGSLQIGGQQAISTDGSGNPNGLGSSIVSSSLTSVGTLTSLNVSGTSKIAQITETMSIRGSNESTTQQYNYENGSVFYHPGLGGNITVNLQNVPTDQNKGLAVTMIVAQGASAFVIGSGANAFGINGTSYTVKWSGGSAPSATANQTEIYSFTLINNAGTWTVLGSKSAFN
jgi:hypothetical protein